MTLVDTGVETQTGGRLERDGEYLGDETFMLTYGDGVADVDISEAVEFHRAQAAGDRYGRAAAGPVRRAASTGRSGRRAVRAFQEKPKGDGAWVNGGYFVLEPAVLDRIDGDQTYSSGAARRTGRDGELGAFRHRGFWQPMDTLRDLSYLESLWDSGRPLGRCGPGRERLSSRGRAGAWRAVGSRPCPVCGGVSASTSCTGSASSTSRARQHHATAMTSWPAANAACASPRVCPDQERFAGVLRQSSKYDLSAEGADLSAFDAGRHADRGAGSSRHMLSIETRRCSISEPLPAHYSSALRDVGFTAVHGVEPSRRGRSR